MVVVESPSRQVRVSAVSLFDALAGSDWRSGHRKLTFSDALDIRKLYRECGWSQTDIADHFGVSQPQVSKIINNLQWKAAQL